ncbi:MAG: OadG family protein [Clostridiales bacterium]|nr:OadG family protein [Clostridiales bacterium]
MKKIRKLFSVIAVITAAFLCPAVAFASEAGETMSEKLAYAARNTVLGICTVFIMLIIIAVIIYCFRFLPKIFGPKDKKKETAAGEKKQEAPTPEPEPAFAEAEAPVTDDLELIAVISAAIAAGEQVPAGSFVVRTIRRRS